MVLKVTTSNQSKLHSFWFDYTRRHFQDYLLVRLLLLHNTFLIICVGSNPSFQALPTELTVQLIHDIVN